MQNKINKRISRDEQNDFAKVTKNLTRSKNNFIELLNLIKQRSYQIN